MTDHAHTPPLRWYEKPTSESRLTHCMDTRKKNSTAGSRPSRPPPNNAGQNERYEKPPKTAVEARRTRSEERRVGKEGRARRWRRHEKEKRKEKRRRDERERRE